MFNKIQNRMAVLGIAAMMLCSCSEHFISDKACREQVESDFSQREFILERAGVDLSSMELSPVEEEALRFMYAYMPLGDAVNLGVDYWLKNYRLTREALDRMPWGKTVPEREMRHFVLPPRVNNENLDNAREVFYEELSPRVAGLSMAEAVLEVNHWCHEKVVYQPTDSRTSAPLATISTAFGRCGEESVFLVSALRAIGIPARQVYTPRWAHTDDNHAWVEAWVDGEWHFLGACEPEPVLDLGWFNAPASRGMLMHTNVFGRYDGPEEIVSQSPNNTTINVTANYAPATAYMEVVVTDAEGTPVPGARVEFRVYNYAEFYPVATKTADEGGRTSLTAGLGDMLVYATDSENFGMDKVSFGRDKSVTIKLIHKSGDSIDPMSFEVVPPVGGSLNPEVSVEMREENDRRMSQEDSIRGAYVATFFTEDAAGKFALKNGFADHPEFLPASRGNHDQIVAFLASASKCGRMDDALALLGSISQKDLRDTPAEILEDHLMNTAPGADPRKVLSPRVSTELLSPFRGYLQKTVPDSLAEAFRADPSTLVDWCRDNLILLDSISLGYVQVTPARVWETRLADKASRDIFFVALCRSLGVPAWKDPVTGTVKYEAGGAERDVDFSAKGGKSDAVADIAPKGKLILDFQKLPMLSDPKYYNNFTLSVFDGGTFRLLNYPEEASWSELFKNPGELDCGYYMLVSGSRMSEGNVLADVCFFSIEEGRTTKENLVIRNDESLLRVLGSFNSEALYDKVESLPAKGSSRSRGSVLSTTGRGYFAVILADSGREPTDHALKDISKVAPAFEEWGRPILVVFATEKDCRKFNPLLYGLPSNVYYGVDSDGSMRKAIEDGMALEKKGELPYVLVGDTFNRVVFFSEGYSIGLGDSIVRVIHML